MTLGVLGTAHAEMMEARGISVETAVEMGLESRPGKGGGDVLVFPYFRNGVAVNHKYRWQKRDGTKGFMQDKDALKILWNEDCLRNDNLLHDPLIITEGEFDGMAAVQSGYARTTSVPDGAPAKIIEKGNADSTKYEYLINAGELLSMSRVKVIILAVDGDQAGYNLLHDLSHRLGRARCKFVTYPECKPDQVHKRGGRKICKDLNEVLEDWGEAGVKAVIDGAQWIKVDGVHRMSELPPLPERIVLRIPMVKFCNHFRVRLGDFSVVTGVPSHGKTTFVNDIMCRLVEEYGVTVAWASFEQEPQRDHRRSLRIWKLRDYPDKVGPSAMAAADQWIDDQFVFIVPVEDEDTTLDWLLDKMEAAVLQYDAKIFVIDPWNEMDHDRNRDETLTEYVGRAIRALRRFAKRFNVHVMVVAHPTKMRKNEDGNYSIPTLYDVSDSSHWYNKADAGLVIHRDGDVTIARMAKSRYHDDIGVPGDTQLMFVASERRFDVLDHA